VHVVRAPVHVRPAPLAGGRVEVDPATAERGVERLDVAGPRRVRRPGCVRAPARPCTRAARRRRAARTSRSSAARRPEHALPEPQGTGETRAGCRFTPATSSRTPPRDVRLVERAFERRAVARAFVRKSACSRVRVHRGAERAVELRERAEERRHHRPAIVAVGRGRAAEKRASSRTSRPSASRTVG